MRPFSKGLGETLSKEASAVYEFPKDYKYLRVYKVFFADFVFLAGEKVTASRGIRSFFECEMGKKYETLYLKNI